MDLDKVREHYEILDDATLQHDVAMGPNGYSSADVWHIILAEATRRRIPIPDIGTEDVAGRSDREDDWPDHPPDVVSHAVKWLVLAGPERKMVAIKVGFCWPAFLFVWLWAATKGLWPLAVGLYFIDSAIIAFYNEFSHLSPVVDVLALSMALAVRRSVGAGANSMRIKKLLRPRYKVVAKVKRFLLPEYTVVAKVWAVSPSRAIETAHQESAT